MNRFIFSGLLCLSWAVAQTGSSSDLPKVRPETEKKVTPEAKPFFTAPLDLESLQRQIDSLKMVVSAYEKKQALPPVDKKLLDMIPIPENQQRIILQNGTVVVGTITGESPEEISLQTSLGRLVIRRNLVVQVDENYGVKAEVRIVGEPTINVYPDREVVIGTVKNFGQKRADFVRVVADLWTSSTGSAGQDSAFVQGRRIKYETGVITDTALEPGATATFKVTVPVKKGATVGYRTQTVRWAETK
ncbi:MAG: hypothetical protein ABIA75_08280 [Candidatus Neomarinimicrobiota bacterium]